MIPQLAAQEKRSRIALKGLRRAEIQSGVAFRAFIPTLFTLTITLFIG